MAWFETWIKNDLAKPINVVQLQGVMFNLDNLANKIGVELEYNGQPAALEGTIAGYVIRNDGTTLNLNTNTGKDGNKAWVILPQEAYTVEGPISIVIKLVYNSAETTIGACAGYVTRSRTSSEIAPTGTVIPSLASLEAAIAAANAAAANAADATDYIAPTEEDNTASAAHAVGSYFIYNGKLMMATSAIAQGATIVPYASGVTNYNCTEETGGLAAPVATNKTLAMEGISKAGIVGTWTAPAESGTIATSAHAVGNYFTYNGYLYRATTAIAQGATIVTTGENANCALVPGGLSSAVLENHNEIGLTAADIATVETRYNESVSTASAAHAKGSYFILGGVLYMATADIAIGDNIVTTGTGANAAQVPGGVTGEVEALSGEVADLKGTFDGMFDAFSERTNADLTPTGYSTIISASTGKWVANSNYKSLIQPIPTGAKYIEITANSSYFAIFAFLKTDGHSSGDTPDYATDSVRTTLDAGTTGRFAIPDDANYIYIQKSYSSTTYTPSSAVYLRYEKIPNVDDTLKISGDAADAQVVGNQFAEIDSILFEQVDVELYTWYSIFISTSNKWNSGSEHSPRCWIVLVPDGAKTLTIKANANYNAVIAFLKSDAHISGTTPDYATESGRTVITPGNEGTFTIPNDAVYLYVQNTVDGNVNTPTSATWLKAKEFEAAIIPLGLHEKPANSNILNIIKRCRQMTDIKWTPAVDLKRLMLVTRGGVQTPETSSAEYYLGTFKAGTEYTGVPYGRVNGTTDAYGIEYGTVGHYIGFDTFISSVSNPKSRLSKEIVGSVGSHRSVIYATVCSGLTCYALNVQEVATSSIQGISGLNLIGKLNDNGVLLPDNMIKIGDVLNVPSFHTGIITDIIRNDDGIIQSVEISEATVKGLAIKDSTDGLKAGGLCIRKGWTRSQLFGTAGSEWGIYSVYRYTGTVPYTPSPYINVGDEFDGFRIEQYPIMPYEGEGFTYKTGYIPDNAIKLVIIQDGYSYARVFKDDVEITDSPFAVTKDAQDNINDISVTEIGAGNYTAYLCNMSNGDVTNLTYACHWTIE